MTWAKVTGSKEQGCEPDVPTLGSHAFLLVPCLNPEGMAGNLPEVSLKEQGLCQLQMRAVLGQKTLTCWLPLPHGTCRFLKLVRNAQGDSQ